MTITRIITVFGIAVSLALSAPACGGKKAGGAEGKKVEGGKAGETAKKTAHPGDPKALVSYLVDAWKKGDPKALDILKPTLADMKEASKKTGEPIPEDKIGDIVAEIGKGASEGFVKSMERASDAKVDWSKVEVGEVEVKDRVEKGLTEHKIKAKLKAGKVEMKLRVRAAKLERGLVLTRKPRLRIVSGGGGDICGRVVANMKKIAEAASDEKGKMFASMILKEGDKLTAKCKEELQKRPETRKQMECQASAKSMDELMACPR